MGTSAIEACCGGGLLTSPERRRLGLRLVSAMASGGLLLLALLLGWLWPERQAVAELLLAVAVMLVAGPVLWAGWRSVLAPSLHGATDILVATAVLAALVVGDLESAALVPLAMTLGHLLEERSLLGSQEAIAALGKLTSGEARRIDDLGLASQVPVSSLTRGDLIEVLPGERIAADGTVEDGVSSIDTASLTGESVPVDARPGSAAHAGGIALDGRLRIRVSRIGSETTLGQVAALLREAESAKPPITRLLERHAGRFLLLVLLIAAGAWFLTGSVTVMMAVLVASCPCALVLAAPATAIAGLAVAARHGILVKGTAFLEELAEVDCVVFDKTGTLTAGALRLVGIVRPEATAASPATDAGLRLLAASLGAGSRHPVSQALAALVPAEGRIALDAMRESGGLGVSARHAGVLVLLGRAELLHEHHIAAPPPPAHDGPLVGLARDGCFLAWFLLADEPRPEAAQAIAELRTLGLRRQVVLTGDRRPVAEAIAAQLGITEVVADLLPQQKLHHVQEELAAGRRPLVIGDGINDALALKAGAVGVAMGGRGSDIALASADLVLLGDDLRRLATAIRLSRRCRRTITINVLLGLGWTAVVVAGAASGSYGAVGAVLLHNLGTLAVLANAGRLLRIDERVTEAGSGLRGPPAP